MKISADDKNRVLELYKQGKTVSDIVQEVPELNRKQITGLVRRQRDANRQQEKSESPKNEVVLGNSETKNSTEQADEDKNSVPEGFETIDQFADSFVSAIDVPEPSKQVSKTRQVRFDKVLKPPSRPRKSKVETDSDKEELIADISVSVITFTPLLKSIHRGDSDDFLKSLGKKSVPELKALRTVIQNQVQVGNLTNQLRHLYYMASSGIEAFAPMIGLRADGYTRLLMSQDDEIRMILQEIALANKDKFGFTQKPELRLAMISCTSLLAVDARNRAGLFEKSPQKQEGLFEKSPQKPAESVVADTPASVPASTTTTEAPKPEEDAAPKALWAKYEDL